MALRTGVGTGAGERRRNRAAVGRGGNEVPAVPSDDHTLICYVSPGFGEGREGNV